MIGAIAGDIIGSVYEQNGIKTKDFPLFNPSCEFTDDTVLTVAVAEVANKPFNPIAREDVRSGLTAAPGEL